MRCETAGTVTTWASFIAVNSSWPILSRFLTEVSTERTASDDHTASDRTDPAPAQHPEVEPGPADCLSILDGISGAVLSYHANHHQPVQRYPGSWDRLAHSRSGHSLAAAPRDLLDRHPYFSRECAPVRLLRWQQRHRRLHVRLGYGLLPACDCHCRDRRLVTSRPPPGKL